jgi:hypothetical protein
MNNKKLRFLKYIVLYFLILSSIFSCTVQKRYHRKGYTITWKKNDRVKVNHQRTKVLIERTTSNKMTVLAQRDSVQMSFEKSEALPIEHEYLVIRHEVFRNKEDCNSKVKTNSNQKLNSALSLKARKLNFNSEISQKTANNKIREIKSDKKDFERAGTDLGIAGVFLLLGLIIAGIGILFSIEVLAIVSFVCFCIAGLFFMLCLFEGLISLLTFGML